MGKRSNDHSSIKGKFAKGSSHSQEFKEELSMDNLAKKALDETLRDGGAFARENSNHFKQ